MGGMLFEVACSGDVHRIFLAENGQVRLLDHDGALESPFLEEPPVCLAILDALRDHRCQYGFNSGEIAGFLPADLRAALLQVGRVRTYAAARRSDAARFPVDWLSLPIRSSRRRYALLESRLRRSLASVPYPVLRQAPYVDVSLRTVEEPPLAVHVDLTWDPLAWPWPRVSIKTALHLRLAYSPRHLHAVQAAGMDRIGEHVALALAVPQGADFGDALVLRQIGDPSALALEPWVAKVSRSEPGRWRIDAFLRRDPFLHHTPREWQKVPQMV